MSVSLLRLVQDICATNSTIPAHAPGNICCPLFFFWPRLLETEPWLLVCLFSGPAVEYNGQTCQGVPTAPPILGQHTKEVLTDLLEYNDMEIHNLEQDGVIESYTENKFE